MSNSERPVFSVVDTMRPDKIGIAQLMLMWICSFFPPHPISSPRNSSQHAIDYQV